MSKFVLSYAETENFRIDTDIYDTLEDAQKAMKADYDAVINDYGEENVFADTFQDDYASVLIDGGYDYMWKITEVA